MTVSPPPYTGDRPRCTKCSHDRAATRWTQAFSRCNAFLTAETSYQEQQRLCRSCDRCGYHWDEALATNVAVAAGRVPLGQQFSTSVVYAPGESRLLVLHTPSGRYHSIAYPRPAEAEAAERVVVMLQDLLDEVDEWGRQPIESPTDPEAL